MSKPKKAVVRVDQSPMNAKRWCVTLECGHEFWKTANRKTSAKSEKCSQCPKVTP